MESSVQFSSLFISLFANLEFFFLQGCERCYKTGAKCQRLRLSTGRFNRESCFNCDVVAKPCTPSVEPFDWTLTGKSFPQDF